MGGFIGVNYAASKLPWTSSMQVSCTLALISAALWFLFDRTFHGFMISLTVASMGTTVAYFLVLNGWYRYVVPCITHSLLIPFSCVFFLFVFLLLPLIFATCRHNCSHGPSRGCCWNRSYFCPSLSILSFSLSSTSHSSATFFPAGRFELFICHFPSFIRFLCLFGLVGLVLFVPEGFRVILYIFLVLTIMGKNDRKKDNKKKKSFSLYSMLIGK